VKSSATVSRELAWRTLIEYQKSREAPDLILGRMMPATLTDRDRTLAWDMTMGAVRLLKRLDFMAQAYIKAPVLSQKPEVLAALRIGFLQLTEMTSVPQYAAVDETVRLLSERSLKRDAGFVNAVLRAYLREPARIDFPDSGKDPISYLSVFYSYPKWLVRRWLNRYGYLEAERMLAANNQRPRMVFRVMAQKSERERVIESLRIRNIEVEEGKHLPEFLSSSEGLAILRSDLFKDGFINVQDESQGLPVLLIDPPRGETVLDLCAAPGGKTVALADRVGPDGAIIAVDIDPARLRQIKQNIKRMGLGNVECVCADILRFAPKRKFRYILLDVPCSDLGTLAQNADLRWNKRESDIGNLSKIQFGLLSNAAEMLEDGGALIYSTCTTEPEEIEDVTGRFLELHSDFFLQSISNALAQPFETTIGIYRTWPHRHGMGGGGFARLRRRSGDQNK
jgi:16S rRNA (cytosine967-C5)-methyltransferase